MAWEEYNSMWKNAQEKGLYKIFVFDMKDSKKNKDFYDDIKLLLNKVYNKIENIEIERNISILHKNDIFNKLDRGDLQEPFFLLGDLFGFTILRNTLEDKEIYNIFKETKKNLDIKYQFHYNSGYYETDDYNLRDSLYFRGYCIQYLENKSKKKKNLL